ncbi:PSP1 domain-containing protein [Halanaerobium salsuginis]|jgi:cell fate regulator YaaT (PSP1 superfamily)|uniref:Cell fate regulator YaaT, PSP1 superfamily (Controls sporulation, competence, biofilm development) n=1 Tax=Halanaerobium salsuginis TaxID=29563 RepID=A0A1I4J9C9_9FIRM|nr:stage 0 sporulation family protein [Halanaerobium salsuginis]SFL62726.1 Cell fate regulator YaaT, PSP1 superfamily (controls sporulation, competence, biofilm development) [Halanaerobium salsuginis]
MYTVVGVSFKKAGKIYYFDPGELEIKTGDYVIVETARGIEYAEVVVGKKEVSEKEIVAPLKDVIRKATLKDREVYEKNLELEKDAYQICLEKIDKHALPMKLIDVEYTFDHNKIIFYFTADGRVDFRELVKDLAAIFKTRIELRQIGVRDEAKMLGGLGPCGLPVCCATFLRDFKPISIKMAKKQDLSLNPAKISGLCGRLMCCLRYETKSYRYLKESMPNVGEKIELEIGNGKIVDRNLVKHTIEVDIGTDENIEIDVGELDDYDLD